ncbi:selenoprotein F [Contarinia nasturtii]|uniref:selenoprotein F n=1 Tax=Contarinia nasturtii TaxID=265458 RepID=UPI0012D43363|nr:selenoprotein F [Contarinia nasturtii]
MEHHIKMLFYLSILTILVAKCSADFSSADCRQLGFIKPHLMCSSCDKLETFGLSELKEHCQECCEKDDVSSITKRFPKAILEVCTCKFGAYPQIQAFCKSDRPSKFPNLTIKYLRGADPIVKLLDENDNVVETLSINKWNTDTVVEFFETHLYKEDNDYLRTNRI